MDLQNKTTPAHIAI